MTFKSQNGRVIIFEPKGDLPDGFIEVKKWLNSIALETGSFPEYVFNKDCCRESTQSEWDYYTSLKDKSVYSLNAE